MESDMRGAELEVVALRMMEALVACSASASDFATHEEYAEAAFWFAEAYLDERDRRREQARGEI